jgi:hypothetical protein
VPGLNVSYFLIFLSGINSFDIDCIKFTLLFLIIKRKEPEGLIGMLNRKNA